MVVVGGMISVPAYQTDLFRFRVCSRVVISPSKR